MSDLIFVRKSQLPLKFNDLLKILHMETINNKIIVTELKGKKFVIYNDLIYPIFLKEAKKFNSDSNYYEFTITPGEILKEPEQQINPANVSLKFDNNNEYAEKRAELDKIIDDYVNFVLNEQSNSNAFLDEQKEKLLKSIDHECYYSENHLNFQKEEIFKNLGENLDMIPIPPNKLQTKDIPCNYCKEKIKGRNVYYCKECNIYICEECKLKFNEYCHRHFWCVPKIN